LSYWESSNKIRKIHINHTVGKKLIYAGDDGKPKKVQNLEEHRAV